MLVGAVIYIFLEVAFLGALNPHAATHGWANLSFTNQFGPLRGDRHRARSRLAGCRPLHRHGAVARRHRLDLHASSARLSYALAGNGYIPRAFEKFNDRGVRWFGVLFAFAVGMIVFLPFPGWQKLVGFITSVAVLIYAAQCLSLAAMRRQLPDWERPFRPKAAAVLGPLGLVIAKLIVIFAGWTIDSKMFPAIGIGLVLLAVSQLARRQLSRSPEDRVHLDWGSSAWMWPWLLGLLVISLFSSFPGGRNDLHFGVDMAATAAFSLLIDYFALTRRVTTGAREGADEDG